MWASTDAVKQKSLESIKGHENHMNQTFWGAKKHIKKKARKHNFHGIVPGFWGGFCYLFFSPTRNDPKKTHRQIFATNPVPGQSRKFVYVYVFFLFVIVVAQNDPFGTAPLPAPPKETEGP